MHVYRTWRQELLNPEERRKGGRKERERETERGRERGGGREGGREREREIEKERDLHQLQATVNTNNFRMHARQVQSSLAKAPWSSQAQQGWAQQDHRQLSPQPFHCEMKRHVLPNGQLSGQASVESLSFSSHPTRGRENNGGKGAEPICVHCVHACMCVYVHWSNLRVTCIQRSPLIQLFLVLRLLPLDLAFPARKTKNMSTLVHSSCEH